MKTSSRALWLALLTLQLPLAAGAESTGQRWALLIGVNDYASLQDLKYCSDDVRALEGQLLECGFEKDHVFTVRTGAADSKFFPSKSNIEQQLKVVSGLAESGDLVLVYFSGHGLHMDGRSYLCPADGRDDEVGSLVPLSEVFAKLDACQASLKLLIADACRNDPRPPGRRSSSPEQDLKRLGESFQRPPEGTLVLTTCRPGERALEDSDLKQSVFMHFLLEGLAGAADKDGDDQVSIGEATGYSALKTKLYVSQKYNDLQRPEWAKAPIEALDYPLARRPSLKARFTNSLGLEMVLIPQGEFLMGSGESAQTVAAALGASYMAWEFEDEHPQHRVRLTKPFYLGAHEVTWRQFAQFIEATDYQTEAEKDGKGGWGYDFLLKEYGENPDLTWRNLGSPQTDRHPVVYVSWNDAVAFCTWLARKEGRTYRLPTEAEWEYACRAGTTTRYWHGDNNAGLAAVGNVADAMTRSEVPNFSRGIAASDGYALAAPVGSFRANPFGLYDMHGNVQEWCQDWYGSDYYRHSPAADPTGPNAGEFRVLRDGSWYDIRSVRSASRDPVQPAERNDRTGFRVCCESE